MEHVSGQDVKSHAQGQERGAPPYFIAVFTVVNES